MENPTETEDKKCTVCDYIIENKTGHIHTGHLTKVGESSASCTVDGNIEYYTCSCGMWFADATATTEITNKDSVKLPALKHDLAQVPAKPATCTEIGWNAYEKCSRCSYSTYVELPMIEHTYTSDVVKPQFGVQGYTLHKCSACDYSYKDNYTDALTYLPGGADGNVIRGVELLIFYPRSVMSRT